jgi:hypothetical protein
MAAAEIRYWWRTFFANYRAFAWHANADDASHEQRFRHDVMVRFEKYTSFPTRFYSGRLDLPCRRTEIDLWK